MTENILIENPETIPEETNQFSTFDDTQQLDYIKNGEELTGFESENDIGTLNRTQSQLFEHIKFLRTELLNLIKTINKPKEDFKILNKETKDNLALLGNQIENIVKVTSQKLADNEKRLNQQEKDIQQIKIYKPTNFLEFAAVQDLILKIKHLEAKIKEIEAFEASESAVEAQIDVNLINPIIERLNALENSFRNLYGEFGQYDSEDSAGYGIKHRIQILSEVINQVKQNLESYRDRLSEQQELRIQEIIDSKQVPLKIRNDQSYSIVLEVNQKVHDQEEKLNAALTKYHIDDEVLQNIQLQDYLKQIKESSSNALETANQQKEKSQQLEEQLSSTNEIVTTNTDEISKLKTLLGESEYINENLVNIVATLVGTVGNYDTPNSIIGQLSKIEALKNEFSENIQNINMIIGQNVPGSETGLYRQLLEAKQARARYYRLQLSRENILKLRDENKKLVIYIPEYISSRGNSFIVRTLKEFKNLLTQYDNEQKKLYIIGLGDFNYNNEEQVDIILLPINVEPIQLDQSTVYYEEKE